MFLLVLAGGVLVVGLIACQYQKQAARDAAQIRVMQQAYKRRYSRGTWDLGEV
jgi:hypothetical protein